MDNEGVIEARLEGWLVHTDDFDDEEDVKFEWRFAAGWTEGDISNPQVDDSFYMKGTAKGYKY